MVIGLWMASGYLVGDSQGSMAEGSADEPPSVEPMTVEVRTQTAQRVSRRLEAQGEALANRRVTLRGETSGRVVEIKVERGATVEAGQPLVELAMNDRRARLERARALVAQREADYKAAEQLGRSGFQSESERRQAFAALQSARAELESIQEDIANTTIRAPFAGVVEDRMVELGDYITAGDGVAMLVDKDPLRVRVDIAQQQIRKLERGAEARIELATGDSLTGRVTYISPRASEGTHTFPVDITAANPDGLPAGVSATVTLPLESEQAHFISPALLALDTDGTLGAKTVTDDGRVRFNPVAIVRTERDGVWVTGLPAQARIITRGQGFVRDGEPVRTVTAAESELDLDPAAGERPAITGEG
ncbi:efflux RND transporter periplasmic adaptor subunit [Ectothiorhodospiraceae bacterium WFHF3C12]|nr:efflux RND transporter periplasmic adaptor subunit [Ectothiorhodospiraceae bacterium WFHF3C12]